MIRFFVCTWLCRGQLCQFQISLFCGCKAAPDQHSPWENLQTLAHLIVGTTLKSRYSHLHFMKRKPRPRRLRPLSKMHAERKWGVVFCHELVFFQSMWSSPPTNYTDSCLGKWPPVINDKHGSVSVIWKQFYLQKSLVLNLGENQAPVWLFTSSHQNWQVSGSIGQVWLKLDFRVASGCATGPVMPCPGLQLMASKARGMLGPC